MKTISIFFGILVTIVVLAFILALIMAYPFMLLWNYGVVPATNFTNEISFWQAFCLMLILSFFKSSTTVNNKSE